MVPDRKPMFIVSFEFKINHALIYCPQILLIQCKYIDRSSADAPGDENDFYHCRGVNIFDSLIIDVTLCVSCYFSDH